MFSSSSETLLTICVSDAHIYYFQQNEEQTNYARALRERIVRECKLQRL